MRYQHQGRTEQFKASVARLEDAEALRDAKRWRGAMYLAGYGLECRLKAILMENYHVETLEELNKALKRRYPEFKESATHDLRLLFSFMNVAQALLSATN